MNNETSLSDLGKIIETERFALLRYACYRLGNKEDAEDAVHDCYLKLYKRFSAQQDTMVADLNHYVFRSLEILPDGEQGYDCCPPDGERTQDQALSAL